MHVAIESRPEQLPTPPGDSDPPRVLVVEDDATISELLEMALESAGYTVDTAADGPTGLDCVASTEFDLVLLDLMLPGIGGLEVCERVRASSPWGYLPIIMVTALGSPEHRHAGFTAGADDYVTKPFNLDELLDRVQVWTQTRRRLVALHAALQREQEERSQVELQAAVARVEQAHTRAALTAAIKVLAAAIEARDPYTGGHVARVAAYAVATARELGWDPHRLVTLEFAATLHDLGKIGVEDRILRKPGPLDPAEREQMRQHTRVGARILENVPYLEEENFLEMARSCALYHQERYDGLGYPQGLRGSAIPQEARIVAVADTFDAMTTDRPYREALSREAAIGEIEREAGTQFDPEVVAAFLRVIANDI